MNTLLAYKTRPVAEIQQQTPTVTIVMPFEPKMTPKANLQTRLKEITSKVREQLQRNYSHELTTSTICKLNESITNLDFLTYKKSIAILLSPVFAKVYYLDFPVNEKIIVGEAFNLREVIESKKDLHKYLVLVMSGEDSRIYLGSSHQFIKIVSNLPQGIQSCENDLPEKVGNFTDPSQHKEVLVKKFLKYIDDGLSLLLEAYPLPLFVLGSKKMLGYFRKITRNQHSIVDYIHGSFSHYPESSIQSAIAPYVLNWESVRQKDLFNRLESGAGAGKLAIGTHEVRKETRNKNARLLVIEKSFSSPIRDRVPGIFRKEKNDNIPLHIRDGVDQLIEEVIESGGEVEFVEDGSLESFDHMALVKYY